MKDRLSEIFFQFRTMNRRQVLIMLGTAAIVMLVSLSVVVGVQAVRSRAGEYENAILPMPEIENFPVFEEEEYVPEEPEEEVCDLPRSRLTGLAIKENYFNRRPLAVVINNIHEAQPQSGIASADVVYEVLAEGNITRLLGIFQSEMPETIGPVRSARDYFVDLAFNHDGIFVHHGTSPTGQDRMRTTRIDVLDGGRLEGQVFRRDRSFPYWARNTGTRDREHSSFTFWDEISQHIESTGIRDYMNDGAEFGFVFGEIPEGIESIGDATHVTVPFSNRYIRTFIFCGETEVYLVEDIHGAHLDGATMEQAAVANILIQFVTKRVVDAEGRRNIGTVGEGRGYFITRGEVFSVIWEKTAHEEPTRWSFEDGSPLVLTPGRTWINVFQSTGVPEFEVYN
ncbi:MAG: DUF3048 domain-containing protein [Defluviitaleaceae bacterium]|nr:DUF3048 domain-containing protein [Defluviitaleaceae bacterium]